MKNPPQKQALHLTDEHQWFGLCDDKDKAPKQQHKHTGCLKIDVPVTAHTASDDLSPGPNDAACYLITWSGHRNKGAPTL